MLSEERIAELSLKISNKMWPKYKNSGHTEKCLAFAKLLIPLVEREAYRAGQERMRERVLNGNCSLCHDYVRNLEIEEPK